jgi:hypothetical protein
MVDRVVHSGDHLGMICDCMLKLAQVMLSAPRNTDSHALKLRFAMRNCRCMLHPVGGQLQRQAMLLIGVQVPSSSHQSILALSMAADALVTKTLSIGEGGVPCGRRPR